MTRDIISKRTRNEFREFFVGWTLREIEIDVSGFETTAISRGGTPHCATPKGATT